MNERCATKIFLFLSLVVAMAAVVSAANEITQYADKLNYWDAETHAVTLENTAAGDNDTMVNITHPSTFTFSTGTNCASASATIIQCNVSTGGTASYTVTSPGGSAVEYDVGSFAPSTNNTLTGETVSFLRIHPSEVFHTLVEYGRGRGNYFFDSYYKTGNVSGSGHSGIGCPFLPNGTLFELNYLHKVLNIAHYLGVVGEGANVSFECTYPNQTVVRHHLTTGIAQSGLNWLANYSIEELQTSWERMGYLGQNFDSGEYTTGTSILVNCTDLVYELPDANGNVTISEDSFTLTFRDRHPFNVSATASGTIYNGSQEVEVTYTITNTEQYAVNDIAVEIQAPQYGTFVGTRGELWGVSQEYYRFERDQMLAGESETITLLVRFNTSQAPAMTTMELSQGVSIEYITCWEANAYNPQEYIHDVPSNSIGNSTVDMNTGSNITNIPNILVYINEVITNINNTVTDIYNISVAMNSTIQDIYNLTWWINQSTWNISNQVWTYYSRNLTYYPPSSAGGGGGGGGGGFGSACRWNDTVYYNDSNSVNRDNYTLVYGSESVRVDYPNRYNDTVDTWRVCYMIAPQTGTDDTADIFEVYVCNDYSTGNVHTTDGCIITHNIRKSDSFQSNHPQWSCSEISTNEITGTNISIVYECGTCTDSTDAWRLYFDGTTSSTYTYNTSDGGSTWNLFSNEAYSELGWCVPIDFGAEVWSYNNRTLTDYNFSWIYDQFDCSQGNATNEICELLYAINETTQNTWQTIQIVNNTVNAIDGNVTLIYNDTQYIIDLLNCNSTTDSAICDMLVQMNNTLEDLYNITININDTVYSLNNTIYLMNQTMIQRFDGIDANLSLIYNLSINIQDLINCTNISAQWQNSTCNRLDRIETDIYNLNITVENIQDIVQYINTSRWLNYTAQDLLDRIDNMTIDVDLTEVLRQISLLREFDEELVFLVTDAFNLQTQARSAANNGQIDVAAARLTQSQAKLDEATRRLNILNGAFEAEKDVAERRSRWWIWVVVLGGICGAFIYMFQKVPEEPEPPRVY